MSDDPIHLKPPFPGAREPEESPDEGATRPLDAESFDEAFTDEPTRVAPPDYDVLAAKVLGRAPEHATLVAQEAAEARASGFDREETRVAVPPDPAEPVGSGSESRRLDLETATLDAPPELDEDDELTAEVPAAEAGGEAEQLYRDQVQADISFSKSTGYDKESTAVVPLAELARREELRLKRDGQAAAEERPSASQEGSEDPRAMPMGEIIDVLRAAETVEEVAGVLVEIVANLLPRVLLLWQRHGHLVGFASRGTSLTQVELLTLEMPLSVLQEMTAAPLELETFVGPPRLGGQAPKLFKLLGYAPKEILIIPGAVTAEDRWLLYADNGHDPLPQMELRLLEVIVSRAGARADLLLDRSLLW